MRILWALLLALALPAAAAAEPEPCPETPHGAAGACPSLAPRAFPFEFYKPMYFLSTWDYGNPNGQPLAAPRQLSEARFQISFRIPLPSPYDSTPRGTEGIIDAGGIFAAYSQRSFWQWGDKSRSRPFREADYNPEVFFVTRDIVLPSGLRADLQISPWEHESNGQVPGPSRSWDRAYVLPRILLPGSRHTLIAWKYWMRLDGGDPTTAQNPTGDDNPDILRYLGRSEVQVVYPYTSIYEQPHPYRLELLLRNGFKAGTETVNAAVSVKIPGIPAFLRLDYFYGYGESLIDYNVRVKKVGIGIAVY